MESSRPRYRAALPVHAAVLWVETEKPSGTTRPRAIGLKTNSSVVLNAAYRRGKEAFGTSSQIVVEQRLSTVKLKLQYAVGLKDGRVNILCI